MSYDLHLFRAEPGSDLLAAAKASMERQDEDIDTAGRGSDAEVRKQALVAALQAVNPALEPFVFDHAEIARLQNVTEAEARRRWRHVELNGPADGNGIQLTLDDDSVSITVPYWHRGDEARNVWREIWRYLEALQREGGFAAYDPQLDRVLDLARDREAVLDAYGGGVGFADQAALEGVSPKKPWWKLW
jgi:hypothetical protein